MILQPKSKARYDVAKATEILREYGLVKDAKGTRLLIQKGRLHANHNGNNPDDRRAGYSITGKAIYDLVTREIPAVDKLLKRIDELEKQQAAVTASE